MSLAVKRSTQTKMLKTTHHVRLIRCLFTLRRCTEEVQPSWFGSETPGGKWSGPDPGATSEIPNNFAFKNRKFWCVLPCKINSQDHLLRSRQPFWKCLLLELRIETTKWSLCHSYPVRPLSLVKLWGTFGLVSGPLIMQQWTIFLTQAQGWQPLRNWALNLMDWGENTLQCSPALLVLFPVSLCSSREWDNVDRSVRSRLQNRSEDGEFW